MKRNFRKVPKQRLEDNFYSLEAISHLLLRGPVVRICRGYINDEMFKSIFGINMDFEFHITHHNLL
jgi:hypothetical protein